MIRVSRYHNGCKFIVLLECCKATSYACACTNTDRVSLKMRESIHVIHAWVENINALVRSEVIHMNEVPQWITDFWPPRKIAEWKDQEQLVLQDSELSKMPLPPELAQISESAPSTKGCSDRDRIQQLLRIPFPYWVWKVYDPSDRNVDMMCSKAKIDATDTFAKTVKKFYESLL